MFKYKNLHIHAVHNKQSARTTKRSQHNHNPGDSNFRQNIKIHEKNHHSCNQQITTVFVTSPAYPSLGGCGNGAPPAALAVPLSLLGTPARASSKSLRLKTFFWATEVITADTGICKPKLKPDWAT